MTLKLGGKAALGFVALAVLGLGGCATTEGGLSQQSAQWVGKDTAALTAQWGPAEEKKSLGDGSELWVYHKTKQGTVGDAAPTTTTRKERTETYQQNGVTLSRQVAYDETSYDPATLVASSCEVRFVIKDGVVKSAEFKGSGCS